MKFAKMAKECNIQYFAVISSYAAKSDSRTSYYKIKGKMEDSLRNMAF
jgi:hypothetical protein